jgi:hypothetical protein
MIKTPEAGRRFNHRRVIFSHAFCQFIFILLKIHIPFSIFICKYTHLRNYHSFSSPSPQLPIQNSSMFLPLLCTRKIFSNLLLVGPGFLGLIKITVPHPQRNHQFGRCLSPIPVGHGRCLWPAPALTHLWTLFGGTHLCSLRTLR